MRNRLRRWWAFARQRWGAPDEPLAPTPEVTAFLSGLTVRETAYYYTTGDDWPDRVRSVERDLRAYINSQARRIDHLESIVEGSL